MQMQNESKRCCRGRIWNNERSLCKYFASLNKNYLNSTNLFYFPAQLSRSDHFSWDTEKVRIRQKSFVLLLNLVAVCIIAREGKAKIIVQFLAAKKGFEIFFNKTLMVKLLRTDHTSIPQGLDLLLELVTREERDYGVQQFRKIHGLPGYNVLKGNITYLKVAAW